MLAAYLRLLEKYHQEISQPGWCERVGSLIKDMDRVWAKLTDHERDHAMHHAQALYQARIR